MNLSGKVLIVDDDPEFGLVAQSLVELEGLSAHLVNSGSEALALCDQEHWDVVLLDLMLGDISGLDVLREIRRRSERLPVIMVTAHGSMETAAEAVQAEAFGYIGKPFRAEELKSAIRRALEWRKQQHNGHHNHPGKAIGSPSIVGRSSAMVAVYTAIARVAATDSTVLISGESGTGKELVARALHDNSPRSKRPFIPVNCGAFTETLLESELFGHVRGSFTGAMANHRGIFETATGGTIFLDEISETSPAFQVKLLRVIQEQEVRPVGAPESRRVDVRIVAATNRRVQDLFSAEDFRRDLLYRLGVINLELPPLRERKEDIPLLVEHFLQRFNSRFGKTITAPSETIDWLCQFDWPGNVRELENAVERAVTLNVGGKLSPDDFMQFTPTPLARVAQAQNVPANAQSFASENVIAPASPFWVCELPKTLEDVERQHILAMLRFTKGNKLRASELLGIGRYSLYRKAERLGIDLNQED
ncbi:MAG: sigma-54-dependent Fis family transcriptional regulator [Acidobacteria bacterium]|nr:sigma-54-dependent Fis family transcriptional regulator [Acidobacteriota bacterium]